MPVVAVSVIAVYARDMFVLLLNAEVCEVAEVEESMESSWPV